MEAKLARSNKMRQMALDRADSQSALQRNLSDGFAGLEKFEARFFRVRFRLFLPDWNWRSLDFVYKSIFADHRQYLLYVLL